MTKRFILSANDQVERYNRIDQSRKLVDGISVIGRKDGVICGIAMGAIKGAVDKSTWFTSNIMMLGKKVIMPLDIYGVQRKQKTYYNFRKKTAIYTDVDVLLRKNNTHVLGSSKKMDPVWKGIWVVKLKIIIKRWLISMIQ